MNTKEIISDILKQAERENAPIERVFFVGCGGSFAAHYPAKYLLEHESKTLGVFMYTSNEFVFATPKSCDQHSLVLVCSMKGTAETCQAAKVAAGCGATVVALYVEESDMTRAGKYTIKYNSIAEDSNPITETNGCLLLEFAAELLHQLEDWDKYAHFMAALNKLDGVYRTAKLLVGDVSQTIAAQCRDDKVIYVLGAGPCTGAAYIFAICNLMEMQWVHSSAINAGEFFHGPFEVVDKEVPFICLLSTGRTRPMDDRAMVFLEQYGQRNYVLDSEKLGLTALDASVAEFFCPIILSSLLQNVVLHDLADAKEHPYTTRRYMWKVAY